MNVEEREQTGAGPEDITETKPEESDETGPEDITETEPEESAKAGPEQKAAGAEAPAELKLVLHTQNGRTSIGVWQTGTDPHLETFPRTGADAALDELPGVLERARARWGESHMRPKYEPPKKKRKTAHRQETSRQETRRPAAGTGPTAAGCRRDGNRRGGRGRGAADRNGPAVLNGD